MSRKKSVNEILDELIDLYTPKIAEAFRTSIQDVTDRVILKDIIKALQDGDPERAFKILGYSEAAMRPMIATIESAFEAGGFGVASTFPIRMITPDGPTVYRFDIRNVRAERWLRQKSGGLISRIGDDIRTNIRNVMETGVVDGRNPRNIALDIVGRINRKTGKREGGIIGLNKPQENAVRGMQNDLENLNKNYFNRKRRDKRFDRTVLKMFEKGKVSNDDVIKLTSRYKDNLLKLRGDTIARDSAMEALNHSEWEALKQAQDLGAVKNVKRAWDSTGRDGRTRDDHLTMDDHKLVGLDEPFIFPDGSRAMHPQDRSLGAEADQTINCRCRTRTVIDWYADVV